MKVLQDPTSTPVGTMGMFQEKEDGESELYVYSGKKWIKLKDLFDAYKEKHKDDDV